MESPAATIRINQKKLQDKDSSPGLSMQGCDGRIQALCWTRVLPSGLLSVFIASCGGGFGSWEALPGPLLTARFSMAESRQAIFKAGPQSLPIPIRHLENIIRGPSSRDSPERKMPKPFSNDSPAV